MDMYSPWLFILLVLYICGKPCGYFEGTNDGESYSKELVESEMEEPSTSRRVSDDFDHNELEQDIIYLMGSNHQEGSSS